MSPDSQSNMNRGPAVRISLAIAMFVLAGSSYILLSPEPDEGFTPGDIVAYRCADCLDRWDLELTADDLTP